MTTRTVKMFGLAYGSTPAEISITLDGTNVYTGTVTTQDAPVLSLPNLDSINSTVEFCNFEIPIEFSGTKPMTCAVNNGTVIFAQITANYCAFVNVDPPAGQGPDVFLNIGGVGGLGDARSNVFIDGVAQAVNHNEELNGTWWFTVPSGSVLSYDLDIVAGTANVAPAPVVAP